MKRERPPTPKLLASPRAHRALTLPVAAAALLAGCFVNDLEESAGNTARQDTGLHVRLAGNFVLNRDGSRIVTTALLGDAHSPRTHLVGLTVPDLHPLVGPAVDGLASPEIMLTPDPNVAWLVGTRTQGLDITPLFLDTMTAGAPLDLPAGAFNATILSGDGRRLALGEVWNARHTPPLLLLDVPTPPTALAPDPTPLHLELPGALFDARFTRAGDRLVVLTVPIDDAGHFTRAATVSVYDTTTRGAALLVGRVELPEFALNLLGALTWSIRITPDGRFAGVSGRLDGIEATHVIRLADGTLFDTFPCDGPVGFGPDSRTMVGFREEAGGTSALVINDLDAGTSEVVPTGLRDPVYWITPDGARVVTYALGEGGLVIADLDSLEVAETHGADVRLSEFAVSSDGDFVYLVDEGALYLLDLELGAVEQLEPASHDYDNINILPDGERLVLSGDDTQRFDLWSVVTGRTERTARLPSRR